MLSWLDTVELGIEIWHFCWRANYGDSSLHICYSLVRRLQQVVPDIPKNIILTKNIWITGQDPHTPSLLWSSFMKWKQSGARMARSGARRPSCQSEMRIVVTWPHGLLSSNHSSPWCGCGECRQWRWWGSPRWSRLCCTWPRSSAAAESSWQVSE